MLTFFFSFQGRISRRQYWRGAWLLGLINAAALVLMFFLPIIVVGAGQPLGMAYVAGAGLFFLAAFVTTGVSWLAMSVKRAHDLGRPGRALFGLSGLSLLFSEGEPHANRYGPAVDRPTGAL